MSERNDRQVAEAGERFEREAEELQKRGDRLRDDIDSVRQDFERKRNDPDVVGLPPTSEERDEPPGSPGEEPVHGQDPNDTDEHEDEGGD